MWETNLGVGLGNMFGQIFKAKSKQGSPVVALNHCLEALGSPLRVEGRVVRSGNRQCQVFGRYIDFWENGMKWLGVDCVSDTHEMALLLHYWLDLRLNSTDIEHLVPGIQFPESRKKIEEGEESYLDWYWKNLISKKDRRFGRLIELFAVNQQTRKLMSFTRLRDFGFSRVIPPNGSRIDLPFIRVNDSWEYEVHVHLGIMDEHSGARRCIGKGNAEEACALILACLPQNIGVAKYCYLESESPAA
jgi:hypothetical protein